MSGFPAASIRLTLAVCLLSASALRAQQPPTQEPPAIRVDVDRVNVGVIVTDSGGHFVEGLRREDFRVFDSSIEQPITDFAAVDEPAQVLLLIEAGPAVYLLEGAYLQAAHGLLQGLTATDLVAVAKYSDTAQAVLGFTPDKQLAESALGALHYNLGFGSLNLSSSLSQILAWLRGTNGKKSVILLSTGVDTSPSNESLAILSQLRVGEVRIFAVSLAAALRTPAKNKKKSPSPKSVDAEQRFAEADQLLRQLAAVTGGRAYFPVSASDFRAVYAELAQLIRHEYSLAFAPQTRDGAVHAIKVTINRADSMPNRAYFRVEHRQAYAAPEKLAQ